MIIDALERFEITELTAFFQYNSEYPETNVPCIKFPDQAIFSKGQWKIRQREMRKLFVILMTFPDVMDPKGLFDAFSEEMSETLKDLSAWVTLHDVVRRLRF